MHNTRALPLARTDFTLLVDAVHQVSCKFAAPKQWHVVDAFHALGQRQHVLHPQSCGFVTVGAEEELLARVERFIVRVRLHSGHVGCGGPVRRRIVRRLLRRAGRAHDRTEGYPRLVGAALRLEASTGQLHATQLRCLPAHLADELDGGSLRTLKPGVSLLRDRLKSYERREIIEPRRKIERKKAKAVMKYEPGARGEKEIELMVAAEKSKQRISELRALVAALILLHNRGAVPLTDLLPLFFRLFRVKDKQLRITVFRHVVAAVKAANKKRRDERLNRDVQTFLQTALTDENETAAKKALAVITELYRKRVWGDARTVNLVAEACAHPSAKILVAACKFFLGQDEAAEAQAAEGDDEEDSDEEADKPKTGVGTKAGTSSGVSKEDVYKAYNKGAKPERGTVRARESGVSVVRDPRLVLVFPPALFSPSRARIRRTLFRESAFVPENTPLARGVFSTTPRPMTH